MSNSSAKTSLWMRALAVAGALVVLAVAQPNRAIALSGPVLKPRLSAPSAGREHALHGRGPVFAPRPPGPLALCPVDRPRHYVDDFGDARYAGGYHRHEGIDIMAPFETPIRAPFDGRADSSTSWAGGLQVYVYGRAGFVFNAHLTRAGQMGKVEAGTIVGYVGNTGDAQGGSPHDHFEWHPKGGPAVDPFRLLNRVCGPAKN
jgi:murein DD-endopeptidase MepM/ murein hydrolase activator NlpD